MSENVIFCYSGTGNCLDMAKTIARELGDTDIILMRREPAVTDVRDAKRVGFVFPCYGGGLPGGVEESLRKIQVGLTAYTFGVCQYAGYMGSGLYKLDSIIPLRGNIRIEGGRAVIGGNCIQCLSCLQYCPQQAISIGRITDRREHYHNPNVTAAELTESVIHVD